MEQIITFVAKDGTKFDDGLACAEHEFNVEPELVEKINNEHRKYKEDMHRWCSGQACACMGCANHSFYKLGLSQEHHEVWMTKFQSEIHPEGYDIRKPMKIVLIESSSIKKFILYLKRHHYFKDINSVVLYKKLASNIIFEANEYYLIESIEKHLKNYSDVKFKIIN